MQEKQQWYQKNQLNMSREDEQEYLEYCAEAMFRIHILELRLNRLVQLELYYYYYYIKLCLVVYVCFYSIKIQIVIKRWHLSNIKRWSTS